MSSLDIKFACVSYLDTYLGSMQVYVRLSTVISPRMSPCACTCPYSCMHTYNVLITHQPSQMHACVPAHSFFLVTSNKQVQQFAFIHVDRPFLISDIHAHTQASVCMRMMCAPFSPVSICLTFCMTCDSADAFYKTLGHLLKACVCV